MNSLVRQNHKRGGNIYVCNKFLDVDIKNLGQFQFMRFFGGGGKLILDKLEILHFQK